MEALEAVDLRVYVCLRSGEYKEGQHELTTVYNSFDKSQISYSLFKATIRHASTPAVIVFAAYTFAFVSPTQQQAIQLSCVG